MRGRRREKKEEKKHTHRQTGRQAVNRSERGSVHGVSLEKREEERNP